MYRQTRRLQIKDGNTSNNEVKVTVNLNSYIHHYMYLIENIHVHEAFINPSNIP